MESIPLAIIYALREELRPIFRKSRRLHRIAQKTCLIEKDDCEGFSVVFCQTGVGMANAHEGAELLLQNYQPQLVLSTGYAGSTQPHLKTGDLILAKEIVSETPTDHFFTDLKTTESLATVIQKEGLVVEKGSLQTVWKIADKSQKEEAGKKGILALDMETAAVAAVVKKYKIPFVSLRVIFDTLEETLPFLQTATEGVHPVSFLVKNPKSILSLLKFYRMNQICQKNLARVLSGFIKSTT